MPDTLTLFNWTADQRRYVASVPLVVALVAMIRTSLARTFDADGAALMQRIALAVYRASVVLQPADAAPLAQRLVYHALRRAAHLTVLATRRAATGIDGPILTEAAQTALITLETSDPLIDITLDRAALLAVVLDGLSWRVA